MTTLAYLGPAGTFTHMAALSGFGPSTTYVPAPTIADVFDAVASQGADIGVVPVENSTEGSVGLTLDCLLESEVRIRGELLQEVSHCLMARERELSTIRRVTSHPQALAQCRRWLARTLPEAELLPAASTASAAKLALSEPATAAIASRLSAELFDLELIAEGIQDRSPNVTRFLVLGTADAPATGRDRTSIVFSLPHREGALLGALGAFHRAGINLTRIESRPLAGRLWEYLFFVDFEGHRSDPGVAAALADLGPESGSLAVLGSYPRAY